MKRNAVPLAIEIAFETFGKIEDPRIERTKLHSLINVLVMALCGAICGTDGWDELAGFARLRKAWFASFLNMPHGVPSADTFRRVFEAIEPRELESAMQGWVASVSESFAGEVVAIDGKSMRGAVAKAGSTTPLHLLHVWAVGQRLLLAQQRVQGAPGEVNAIPELLKRVRIEGATVTMDANGCTKAATAAIREAKADYVLALKGNRGPIHKEVKRLFADAEQRQFRGVATHRSDSEGHGRVERRIVRALPAPEGNHFSAWRDLKTVVMIDRTRTVNGKTKTERHYYIASLEANVAKIAATIRAHWGIENNLHWMLDVAFDEDSRRIRDERAAENFALISRIALMMLKRSSEGPSVNIRRKMAGWEPDYALRLLAGIDAPEPRRKRNHPHRATACAPHGSDVS